MRFGSAMTLCVAAVCCGVATTQARAQSVADVRDVTFKLTSLTSRDLHLQHGIKNYITLSMVDVGGSKTISIKDPPPFPLLATLRYHDREGREQKAAFACDYRC